MESLSSTYRVRARESNLRLGSTAEHRGPGGFLPCYLSVGMGGSSLLELLERAWLNYRGRSSVHYDLPIKSCPRRTRCEEQEEEPDVSR
ncbi:hypothetical protein INR49_007941 [Caranx melampygus]|nr:hypothetical protein INR49_007941 [Caranx melampygus]